MARSKARSQRLVVDGRPLSLSNLDKILYADGRFAKAQVIDYYIRAAPYLLPHLEGRPVTLKRFPDGVSGEAFYEKDAPAFTPDWVTRFPVPGSGGGTPIRYIVINDRATLVWLANLANLEIHPFLHRVPHLDRPASVVFDLDPGEGADLIACARVAKLLRESLGMLSLECFPKVSGSRGLQLYIPLNTPVSYAESESFARAMAQILEKRHSDLVVARMSKALRTGKVFIDWGQNATHKTTVSVYSLRAGSGTPFVSAPVRWEELDRAVAASDPASLYFTPEQLLERIRARGDLFAPVLTMRQTLPAAVSGARPAAKSAGRARSSSQLSDYSRKRDFRRTSEPPPVRPGRQGSRRRFVIQKHAASHLHYDLRLEMHGVLKSWAVPKGPPHTPSEKRLAMATEDHPIEYLEFEGVIPRGQYGGGTVMVWDIGAYELVEGNYYKGRLRFHLSGRKLKGDYLLTRAPAEGRERWFLTKAEPGDEPPPYAGQDAVSALTGRTMGEIAEQADAVWRSPRDESPGAERLLASLPRAKARFLEPMLARLADRLPEGEKWSYEVKLDGYRVLAVKAGGKLTLCSRRGHALTGRYPSIASALEALPEETAVDGEVVALDNEGRPSFRALQNAQTADEPLYYYVFDVLCCRGRDATGLPLAERRRLLEETALAAPRDPVRLAGRIATHAPDLIRAARKMGLEGLIAKRIDSPYEPGRRSGAWVKFKTHGAQEFVVGGYVPGGRYFDSLLIGYYEADRRLIFIAKLRNGFTPRLREQVHAKFTGLETAHCPFANLPEPRSARRRALTREAMRQMRWLRPELVVQVEFTEITAARHIRHSRFAGLREDKAPRDVRLEPPGPLPPGPEESE